jgi:hypothetical protein
MRSAVSSARRNRICSPSFSRVEIWELPSSSRSPSKHVSIVPPPGSPEPPWPLSPIPAAPPASPAPDEPPAPVSPAAPASPLGAPADAPDVPPAPPSPAPAFPPAPAPASLPPLPPAPAAPPRAPDPPVAPLPAPPRPAPLPAVPPAAPAPLSAPDPPPSSSSSEPQATRPEPALADTAVHQATERRTEARVRGVRMRRSVARVWCHGVREGHPELTGIRTFVRVRTDPHESPIPISRPLTPATPTLPVATGFETVGPPTPTRRSPCRGSGRIRTKVRIRLLKCGSLDDQCV